MAPLIQLLPGDIDDPATQCQNDPPPYGWDMPGRVAALVCTDPGLPKGTGLRVPAGQPGRLRGHLAELNKVVGFSGADAGPDCPPAKGGEGTAPMTRNGSRRGPARCSVRDGARQQRPAPARLHLDVADRGRVLRRRGRPELVVRRPGHMVEQRLDAADRSQPVGVMTGPDSRWLGPPAGDNAKPGWTARHDPGDALPRMPGGGISRRPLHFIILADCSGGMKGEKIQALNFAIADMLPHLAAWERDQEQAQVFIRAIAFATEPWWHIAEPQPVAQLGWKPLQPVPKGLTNMGPAFALAAQALAPGRIERRALRPALLLITDGLATDPPGGFEAGLSALMAQPAGKAALRLAIAIGRDAQSAALDRFIGDPGVPVLVADSSEDIADRLVAASLAVSRMSEAGADRGAVARRLFGVPGDVPSKIFDQDTIV